MTCALHSPRPLERDLEKYRAHLARIQGGELRCSCETFEVRESFAGPARAARVLRTFWRNGEGWARMADAETGEAFEVPDVFVVGDLHGDEEGEQR